MDEFFQVEGERISVKVKIRPGAGINKILGVRNGELVIKIKAPAEKGKANKELVSFLAGSTGISRSEILIRYGKLSRHKVIYLAGGALEFFQALI
jgi:uncharacterized protein (TIGR00251 family)